MPRPLALFLAVWTAAASAQAPGAPVALARVGSAVDADERAYFLLFPGLPEADTLFVTRLGADSVRVGPEAGPGLVLSAGAADTLSALLAEYERLLAPAAPRPTSATVSVAGLIRWRRPFETHAPVIVTRRSDEIEGTLLSAAAGGVLLSTTPDLARTADDLSGLVWVPASEVVRVRRRGFGSRLDVSPGGDPVRYEAEALRVLRSRTAFVRGLPPEIRGWLRTEAAASSGAAPPPASSPRRPLNRWDLAVAGLFGSFDGGATLTDPYGVPGPRRDEWAGHVDGGRLRLRYHATASVGVEVAARAHVTERMTGAELDARRYAVFAGDLVGTYAVLPPRVGGVFATLRAGLSVVRTRTVTELEFGAEGEAFPASGRYVRLSPLAPGAVAGIEAGYRLTRGLSLVAGYDAAVYPGVHEAEVVLRDDRYGLVVQHVAARDATLRLHGVKMGVVLHLITD